MNKVPFVPVRQSTYNIGSQEGDTDEIDFTDVKRFGTHVVGGIFLNMGATTVVINGLITLATGDSFNFEVNYPYIDKSTYTIQWDQTHPGDPRFLVLTIYKAYPEECQY